MRAIHADPGQYRRDVAKALDPANQKYKTALQGLMARAVQTNDLATATEIKKTLDALASGGPNSAKESIEAFLWNESSDRTTPTTLLYLDLGDRYETRIIFSPDGTFVRQDGNIGKWRIEDGDLIVESGGTDPAWSYLISYVVPEMTNREIHGTIAKGRYKGHRMVLRQITK